MATKCAASRLWGHLVDEHVETYRLAISDGRREAEGWDNPMRTIGLLFVRMMSVAIPLFAMFAIVASLWVSVTLVLAVS